MKKPLLYLAVALMADPAQAGVYAHWSFDTDLSDSSPNKRHGTLVDVGTAGNSGITSTAGDFKFGGGAMNFSAERDQVTIPLQSFASGRPYTIAFWAKKQSGDTGNLAQWDMVIGQRGTTNFFIGLGDTANATAFRWRSSSSEPERQADFAVPKDHLWHHYALVASGDTITLYFDGQLFGTAGAKKTGFAFDTIGDAYNNSANYALHGQLDELWVFDEALDAAAVGKLCLENDPGIPQA
ncbi:MAG: LamG domain-containing protein, partial [Verrucomicrobiaceae bacterium]